MKPITSSHPSSSGTSLNQNHFISSAEIKDNLIFSSHSWVIDTCASCHVCSDLKMFSQTRLITKTSVTLPNGTQIAVMIAGTVFLSDQLTLDSVLFVPNFNFNLLSISALTKDTSIIVLFSSHSFHILSYNPLELFQEHIPDYMIGKDNLHNNLYILDYNAPASFSTTNIHHLAHVSSEVWHQRLGHPSPNKIQLLSKYLDISKDKIKHDQLCKICALNRGF